MQIRHSTYKLFNIVSWVLLYILLIAYYCRYSYDNVMVSGVVIASITTICILGAAYSIKHFLLPKFLNRRFFVAVLLAATCIITIASFTVYQLTWIWYQYIDSLEPMGVKVFHSFQYQFFCNYVVVFLCSISSLVYTTMYNNIQAQLKYERLEKEKAAVELDFLKAQINPHYIFNSLNTIYGYVDKANTEARAVLLKFGDVLRYQLYECDTERVSIEQEIEHIKQYMSLQSLRKGKALQVDINVDSNVSGFDIAPMMLTPFIENAFKYVSSHAQQRNILKVALRKTDNVFNFYCYNTISSNSTPSKINDGGIGIENVKRRLDILYPDQYRLDINDNTDSFEVTLKINKL